MKTNRVLTLLLPLLILVSCNCNDNRTFDNARTQFPNPDNLYGPDCWWYRLNGQVNRTSMAAELEAMAEKGFYGATIVEGSDAYNARIPAGPQFGSEQWCDDFVFVLDKAGSLGLKIGLTAQCGWNMGGPMVGPEHAIKRLYASRTLVSGPCAVDTVLALPDVYKGWYRDVAAFAFPLKERCEGIENLTLKLALKELERNPKDASFLLDNVSKSGADSTWRAGLDEIIPLEIDSAGHVRWDAPSGEWSLVRVVSSCTGSPVHTARADWKGLVIDHLSTEAFDFYAREVLDPIIEAAGPRAGKTFNMMDTDSWECWGFNWSEENFAGRFFEQCGYDMIPWLCVTAGYVVEDQERTHAFLADWRKVIGRCMSEGHYRTFSEYAHANALGVNPECSGPHTGPFDGITNYSHSDVAMSEFWIDCGHRKTLQSRFFVKQAASAAHIYGIPIVGAEAMTSIGPHWNDELWANHKKAFDHEVCSGLNRVYFHCFTSAIDTTSLPGYERVAGSYINPRVTWWKDGGPFMDYLRRVQCVAQCGKVVSDVLYYYGDHVPNLFPLKEADPAGVLPGYDYDVTNEDVLLKLKVRGGNLVAPSGSSYRIMVLPANGTLSLEALRKVEDLLHRGATVLGEKPSRLVSLVGGAGARAEFSAIASRLWDGGRTGKGRLVTGMKAREFLLSDGVMPDFESGNGSLDYVHFDLGGRDAYFVSNQSRETVEEELAFRVSGKKAWLWNPVDGSIRELPATTPDGDRTRVPVRMDACGSFFVVFDSKAGAEAPEGGVEANFPEPEEVSAVEGPWEVYFDPEWGGPGKVAFPELIDWTLSADEGIQWYSGTATYSTTFTCDGVGDYILELGDIRDIGIARVRVNGEDCGITWTSPFRVTLGSSVKSGVNTVEIDVTNSWYNRVYGDQLGIGPRRYTTTNVVVGDIRHTPAAPSPSGLLGPVRLLRKRN